jgi:RND family efflux transporter MFP subunit
MKTTCLTILALLLTIPLAGCGPAASAQQKAASSTAPAASSGPLEVVLAGPPVRKTLKLVSNQPARLEAIEQAPLYSRLAGYVAEVHVDYGDRVEAGQPLVRLEIPEMDAELLQKQALIDQALAEIEQAQSGVRAAQAAVASAEAQVVQAKTGVARTDADVRRWQSEFARYEKLAAGGSVNQQLVDETRQKLNAAESSRAEADATIAAAQAAVAQAQAAVEKASADVVAAQARQRVAEANRKFAETMLAYREIAAPFAGVITRRRVDPGHFVQPPGGQAQPVLTVSRTDVIRAFVALPETESAYVNTGDAVTLQVQSLRGAEFPGKISRTSFALDAANRSLETIIDIDNQDGRLRPGMFAMAAISLEEQPDTLTLPSAAVVRQGNEAFCYRLIKGKAVKSQIQLGIRVGDDFEIASGLSDRDAVILNKAGSLKDGQPVEVLKPAS